jgi:hypothetical protein
VEGQPVHVGDVVCVRHVADARLRHPVPCLCDGDYTFTATSQHNEVTASIIFQSLLPPNRSKSCHVELILFKSFFQIFVIQLHYPVDQTFRFLPLRSAARTSSTQLADRIFATCNLLTGGSTVPDSSDAFASE